MPSEETNGCKFWDTLSAVSLHTLVVEDKVRLCPSSVETNNNAPHGLVTELNGNKVHVVWIFPDSPYQSVAGYNAYAILYPRYTFERMWYGFDELQKTA